MIHSYFPPCFFLCLLILLTTDKKIAQATPALINTLIPIKKHHQLDMTGASVAM
jgi:hypothetical protein